MAFMKSSGILRILLPVSLALGGSPAVSRAGDVEDRPAKAAPTRILDRQAANRLVANKGLTLQWIDWDRRGTARVVRQGGVWTLRGRQAEANGPGRVTLDGAITEIGRDYFTFRGRIAITDTPDVGRSCAMDKTWRFAITQNRRYYRLREFEWCDDLTDYIDIYF